MTESDLRARSSWLISFGDVVTLLITFFVMMIALNKADVTELQRWTQQQLIQSFTDIQTQLAQQPQSQFEVSYAPQGIRVVILSDSAFEKGSYTPTPELLDSLGYLANVIAQSPVLKLEQSTASEAVISQAKANGFEWNAQVVIEGHTDNDEIDPRSKLHNNWFLSAMRAQAVMEILANNVPELAQRMSVAGYGEFHPMVSNELPEQKGKNRRVEILINASFEKRIS